jgi:hypothetical protein
MSRQSFRSALKLALIMIGLAAMTHAASAGPHKGGCAARDIQMICAYLFGWPGNGCQGKRHLLCAGSRDRVVTAAWCGRSLARGQAAGRFPPACAFRRAASECLIRHRCRHSGEP